MTLKSHTKSGVTFLAALGLSLALTACGGDDPSKTADTPAPSNASTAQADETEEADTAEDGSSELPDELGDFPVPATYKVRAASSIVDITTVGLYDIPGSRDEMKEFYETELPKAGWEIVGDPLVIKSKTGAEAAEFHATKGDMKSFVSFSSTDNMIELIIEIEPA